MEIFYKLPSDLSDIVVFYSIEFNDLTREELCNLGKITKLLLCGWVSKIFECEKSRVKFSDVQAYWWFRKSKRENFERILLCNSLVISEWLIDSLEKEELKFDHEIFEEYNVSIEVENLLKCFQVLNNWEEIKNLDKALSKLSRDTIAQLNNFILSFIPKNDVEKARIFLQTCRKYEIDLNIEENNFICELTNLNIDYARMLFEEGCDFSKNDMFANILDASDNEIRKILKFLVKEKKIDINRKEEGNMWTVLHIFSSYSTCKNQKKIIKLLVEFGADKNMKNMHGETPLDCYLRCCSNDQLSREIIKLLR